MQWAGGEWRQLTTAERWMGLEFDGSNVMVDYIMTKSGWADRVNTQSQLSKKRGEKENREHHSPARAKGLKGTQLMIFVKIAFLKTK